MSDATPETIGALMPSLCYADAPAAIEWLGKAFGFRAQLVVPGPDDTVMHSQLVCEEPPCLVMVFSRRDDEYGRLQRPPRELGACSQALYLVVANDAAVDAVHERALAAGAVSVMAPENQDYGGRSCTVKDLEGHVWSFGSYDPRHAGG